MRATSTEQTSTAHFTVGASRKTQGIHNLRIIEIQQGETITLNLGRSLIGLSGLKPKVNETTLRKLPSLG